MPTFVPNGKFSLIMVLHVSPVSIGCSRRLSKPLSAWTQPTSPFFPMVFPSVQGVTPVGPKALLHSAFSNPSGNAIIPIISPCPFPSQHPSLSVGIFYLAWWWDHLVFLYWFSLPVLCLHPEFHQNLGF